MKAEYRKLLTQAYDIDKPRPPENELEYYRAFAASAEGPVLEVMCGSGRFLVDLLAEGFDIDGTDASADMLAACEAKCRERGLSARLFEQELQRLDVPRRYALAFCGGGSFGLLSDLADAEEALRRLHGHLVAGGTLLLEVETPRTPSRGGLWGGRFWRRPDGAIIAMRGTVHPTIDDVQEGLGIYELFVDGALVETELNEWTRRFWAPDAIAAAVTAAGFHDVRITVAFSDEPADADTAMVSLVARRR